MKNLAKLKEKWTKVSRGRRWWYPLLSWMTIVLVICSSPALTMAAPLWQILLQGIQIIQLSNVSDAQEVQLGAQIDGEIRRQVRVNQNPALQQYINAIGQNLARNSAKPNMRYTFTVVDNSAVNAFATMGGFTYVNTGLILAADNEAQLASVMGHEIGHITGRHALEQLRQRAIASGIATAAGVERDRLVGLGVQLALSLPNSRNDEYDADRRGLDNIIRAGYAPIAMPEFMKKLATSNSPPEFMSTHPAVPERVNRLNEMIPPQYRSVTVGLDSGGYRRQLQSFATPGIIAPVSRPRLPGGN
jgi:beta-barrel assembly-enhancing protease